MTTIKIHDLENQQYQAYSKQQKTQERKTQNIMETLSEKLSEEETLVSVETLSEKLSEEGLTEVVGVRWLPDGTGVELVD